MGQEGDLEGDLEKEVDPMVDHDGTTIMVQDGQKTVSRATVRPSMVDGQTIPTTRDQLRVQRVPMVDGHRRDGSDGRSMVL